MANTFELISSVTVGAGGAASIDFTSIPSTYTDLCLVTSLRDTIADTIDGVYLRFNGDTTSGNYTSRQVVGSGSSAFSDTNNVGIFAVGNNATGNTFSNCSVYIPNYAGSNQKSYSVDKVNESNATTVYMGMSAFKWSGTAAISSIALTPETASKTFMQYSTAYLYGVKNA